MTAENFSRVGYEAVERLVLMRSAVMAGDVKLIGDDGRGIYALHLLHQMIETINMLRGATKP